MLGTYDDWEKGHGSEYAPRGRGGHVLCGRCNHVTGGSYGPAFVEWCKQGMERMHQLRGRRSVNYHGVIHPLRVLKQVATIFFATSGTGFRDKHPYLVKFVLDHDQKGLPPEYEFSVFWYGGGSLRQTGVAGVINTNTGAVNVLAEFVHPPFGYVLSLSGRLVDRRPESISDFANYSINEAITLNRRLPVLETHWMMPGDYRSMPEMRRTYLVNSLTDLGVREPEEAAERIERGIPLFR